MRVKNYLGLKNKWITLFFLSICFIGNAQTPDASNTLYVNINVVGGTGDGSSWANAIPQLSDALKYARLQYNANNAVYDAQPLKIFVAKGTYKPLYSARNNYFTATGSATPPYTDQENAFVMVKNVQIYGGFDPENNIDDLTDTRIFGSNGSILSGEFGNIWDVNYPYNNARHVMISSDDVGNALLNGFTITRAASEGGNQQLNVFIYPVLNAFGAMYCVRSSPTIENCIFTNNETYGGTLFNYQQSSPTIINCSFTNNLVPNNGGAIYNSTGCSPTITDCSFINNDADNGGAIYNSGNSNPIITNCSFKNNRASSTDPSKGNGGAIWNSASSPIITNSLFVNNRAVSNNYANPSGNGGAIYNVGTSSPVLTNVTIADNLGANTVYSTGSGSTTFNNSIVFGTVSATYTAQYSLIEGNTDFTNGNLDASGLAAADVFNDPTNEDFTLKSGASAINAGNNALNASTTDLAGNPRIQYATIDLGAYESSFASILPDVNGIVYVRPLAYGDGSGMNWANATSNLQGAIDGTNVQKVYVAIGNYPVGGSSYVMKNDVAIYGGFDPDNGIATLADARILPTELVGGSVLDGLNTRPLIWNDNNGLTNTAMLDGFTLMNGYGAIGAMYNNSVAPTYTNLVIRNNEATAGGGGIYNLNAPITLTNAIIANNTAQYGGGMRNNNGSNAEFTNVIIKNNTATLATGGAGGGGIFNENSDLKLTNVLIANNSTERWGGGFRNLSGNPVFTNVTLVNNTAANQPATTAMEIVAGTPQINNSVIFGTTTGTYTAHYSFIEGNSDFTNGNIDASTYTLSDVFSDNTNGDYTLKNSSPAVDAGSNALFANLNALSLDLDGNIRLVNDSIDLGAYENQCVKLYATDVQTACGSYTWIDGITYSANNTTATHTLQSTVTSCDSIVTLNLTIYHSTHNMDNLTECISYTWNGTTYTASGTYLYNYTNANGCPSTDTLHLTINTVDVSTTTTGETISASLVGASYQWIDCSTNTPITGATNQSFTATQNGNYAVVVTDGSCSDTSDCVGITTVGIQEVWNTKFLDVYPNPTQATLTIVASENMEIQLINTLGEMIFTKKLLIGANNMDVRNLSKGVYFIQSQNGYRVKFIKE